MVAVAEVLQANMDILIDAQPGVQTSGNLFKNNSGAYFGAEE